MNTNKLNPLALVVVGIGALGCLFVSCVCAGLVKIATSKEGFAGMQKRIEEERQEKERRAAEAAAPKPPARWLRAETNNQIWIDDFTERWATNRISAEARFKGKLVIVRGMVAKVDTSIVGTPYVKMHGQRIFGGVTFYFSKEDIDALEDLRAEDALSIDGVCTGSSTFENCKIVAK